MTTDFTKSSIVELQTGYRAGAFSPVEVVECLLAHIAAVDPAVHAFITLAADQAIAEAHRCEADFVRGSERGPLHGIPFAAKDLYDSAGMRTTYGSRMFSDNVPAADAEAIRRLKAAGAILIGKTATHEFAWGITTVGEHFAPTRNPWKPDRVAGGSSGGSAVALAAGMVPAALGTDTGGSVRIPANYCGVVGLKPTFGRVSASGVFPLAVSLDHPGPMARTVRDAAVLLQVLAGYVPGDASTAPVAVPDYTAELDRGVAALRIGVCPDLHLVQLSDSVQRVFDQSVAILAGLGARVVEVSMPSAGQIGEAYRVMQQAEAYNVHHYQRELYPAKKELYGTDVAERLEQAGGVSLTAYLDARTVQRRVTADFARLFEHEIDVLVSPIAAGSPALVGEEQVAHLGQVLPFRSLALPYTVPQDVAGLPACAIRAGFDDDGIPVGVQITGPAWGEQVVLRAAHALFESSPAVQERWPQTVVEARDQGRAPS